MEIKYSIIVCTYNRSDMLNVSIPAVLNQSASDCGFELLVVDNASTDTTRHVVFAWQEKDARVRYIHEPIQGLSVARNRGMREASGKYIIYIDNDAEPMAGWLKAIDKGFSDPANPVAVSGPVYLRWPTKKPFWISQKCETLYTCLDHGPYPFLFSKPEHFIVGANMAFKKSILIELGGFNENLGRIGMNLLSGEESELIERIRERGLGIYYSPEAAVFHHVTSNRLSLRWYFCRVFMDGYSQKCLIDKGQVNHSKLRLIAFEVKTLLYFLSKIGLSVLSFQGEQIKHYFGESLQRAGRLVSTYRNL